MTHKPWTLDEIVKRMREIGNKYYSTTPEDTANVADAVADIAEWLKANVKRDAQ